MTYFLLMFASNNAMSDDERVFLFVFHQRKREYLCKQNSVYNVAQNLCFSILLFLCCAV